MIKLRDILREVGETTAAPYPTTKSNMGGSDYHKIEGYSFKTDTGTQYKVYIEKFPSEKGARKFDRYLHYNEVIYVVSFKATSIRVAPGTSEFYSEINDPKNMYRVMATVLSAIKQSIKDDEDRGVHVEYIEMEPTKNAPNDQRRSKFYTAIIQKNMPAGSKIESDEYHITVHLPKSKK